MKNHKCEIEMAKRSLERRKDSDERRPKWQLRRDPLGLLFRHFVSATSRTSATIVTIATGGIWMQNTHVNGKSDKPACSQILVYAT